MATNYNPRIVTDGLVLALDAGNNKSHSTNRYISYGSGLVTQNVTFSINGTGTFQRVAAGTVIGGYTVKATDVVYSYALGATGCHYHGNTVPVPAGVRGTFSFDYFVTGATTYPINNYLANFEGTLTGAVGLPNSLQNVWQRVSFTSGVSASSGTFNAYLYPGACGGGRLADSGTIYYRNPRVEFSSVDTGTENFSSMSNLTTWYDMVGSNNGTLTNTPYHFIGNNANGTGGYMSFDGVDDYVDCGSITTGGKITVNAWIKMATGSTFQHIVDSSSNSWHLAILNDNRPYFYNGSTYHQSSQILSTSTWYMLTGVQSSTLDIYVNGVLSQSIASNLNVTTNNVNIGRYQSASRPFSGNIAQVSIYNRALTADEIKQNFNAQRNRFGI